MGRHSPIRFVIVTAATAAAAAATAGALLACGNGDAPDGGPGACAVDQPSACPSWTNDVQPIIQARCAGCHGAGGVAQKIQDFSTYQGVSHASASIAIQVETCTMPPADAGQPTPIERGTLVKWTNCG